MVGPFTDGWAPRATYAGSMLVVLVLLLWLAVAAGVAAMGEVVRRGRQAGAAMAENAPDRHPDDEDASEEWMLFACWSPPSRPHCEARTRRSHGDLRRMEGRGPTRGPRAVDAGRCQRARCTCAWARRVS